MSRMVALAGPFLLALIAANPATAKTPRPTNPEEAVSFERDVRPILKAQCFHCHGEQKELEGDLDLRLRRLLVEGGWSGPAIVPGKPEESHLLARIEAGEMPPPDVAEKLEAEQIETIRRWIEAGAPVLRAEPEKIGDEMLITYEDRQFWAFQPIRSPTVPEIAAPTSGVRNGIDAFILARLRQDGLTFTPEADRQTLVRRLYFDLIGLPPTPEEVERFVSDPAPDAYERLVDQLLASPHYGERWGRHWLDAAGYSDSEGYTNQDSVRKWAWKYRDYVIRSYNEDKPFDQFLIEQLAGDELVGPPYKNLAPDEVEKLMATGLLRMAPDGTGNNPDDPGLAQNDVLVETVKIVSGAVLGLTVGCAQCHDHRYDPISHADYYQLRAIFDPAFNAGKWRKPQQRLISQYTDADRKRAASIEADAKEIEKLRLKKQAEFIERTYEKELAKLPENVRPEVRAAHDTPTKKRTKDQQALLQKYPSVNVTAGSLYLYDRKAADELKQLANKAKAIRDTKPDEQFLRSLTEVPGQVPTSFVFLRGDHEQHGEKVSAAPLTILAGDRPELIPTDDPSLPTTGRRLAFARWLTSGEHPLTARVIVNRVWRHHFGRGIVDTPGDFGRLGDRPTHPELLDWLSTRFMKNGWSLKSLHRLIVTSAVYRQSIRHDPKYDRIDPDNKLSGGRTVRRLEAEEIRDSILAVSGQLNRQPYGPPVPVMADRVGQWVLGIENLSAGRPGKVIPLNGQEFRRSVYVQARRSRPLAVLATFDWPTMAPNCEARASSTVAPQALMLMNSEFIVTYAQHFAERVRRDVGDEPGDQVVHAWRLAYSRSPTKEETSQALSYLADQTKLIRNDAAADGDKKHDQESDPAHRSLAIFCQVLFSSNEFLYVD